MRLKNVKGSREMVLYNPYVVQDPKIEKNKWKRKFKNDNAIHIEIGMGKGKFITSLAKLNPETNYIGIEKYSSVLIRALEKQEEEQLSNVLFIRMDAEEILDVFGKEEIEKIYLNFSDPWPKDRHAKRRLTSKEYLRRYNEILVKDGVVEFKTDNKGLFEFSIDSVPEAGWKIKEKTYDLHNDSKMNCGNIMTEYEEKFSQKGNPIYKMIIFR